MNAAGLDLAAQRHRASAGRNASVDYLKVMLAIMVVGLHANVFSALGASWDWLTANGLFRMAVPCFLVMNGYYFAEVGRPSVWFKRVFRLYMLWAVLYIPFLMTAHHTREWKFFTFFAGYSHLWYLPATLMAGGLVLFFEKFAPRVLVPAAAFAFIAGTVVSLLGQVHPQAESGIWGVLNNVWASRNGVFFGFPLFASGYLVHRHRIMERLGLRMCLWMLAGSVALLLAESCVFHITAPERSGVDVYFSTVLVGPLAFLAASKINVAGPGRLMSKMASGIYFSHFGLLILLHWLGLSGVAWFFATLCSAAIVAVLLVAIDRGRWGII